MQTHFYRIKVLRDELENEMLPLIKVDQHLVRNKKGQTMVGKVFILILIRKASIYTMNALNKLSDL